MQSKDFVSSISPKLKTEDNEIVSLNGQSFTFRLSIIDILFSKNAEDISKTKNIS